jgi:hypothetical protein
VVSCVTDISPRLEKHAQKWQNLHSRSTWMYTDDCVPLSFPFSVMALSAQWSRNPQNET